MLHLSVEIKYFIAKPTLLFYVKPSTQYDYHITICCSNIRRKNAKRGEACATSEGNQWYQLGDRKLNVAQIFVGIWALFESTWSNEQISLLYENIFDVTNLNVIS